MQTASDLDFIRELLARIASDLELVVARKIAFDDLKVERAQARACGRERTHISFKLAVHKAGRVAHGCVLLPLPDAIGLACLLMMAPRETVAAKRELQAPDDMMKDALLEIGSLIGSSTDGVIRKWFPEGYSACSQGCQGVRANVRPAFLHEGKDELIVGRARARLEPFPDFEVIVMLPPLG